MYKYYNANSYGNFVNDCVIRAIAVAENKSWGSTYDELSRIAKKNGILLDDVNFVEPLLDYRYKRMKTYPGDTVEDVLFEYPNGIYLVTMSGHITVIKDGVVYDTFDCRGRTVKNVWKVHRD